MSRIAQSQLESYLWGAAEHLRGSIDAGDYKQFIFPLLFLKRLCDVYDEETDQALRASGGDAEFAAFAENHRFQVPPEAHWREIRKETRNVGQAIQRAMRAIESANKDKLFGIFGDAQWTNKDRLSDETMRELVEHFSSLELTIASLPEDELGNGYEFLIKKFADDSGHTAAEFYTNRTVVHLMTEMLDVQPGESVYDPTCGSGGMLMSCVAHLKKQGKEWRNVRLFGQERNLMTSSIARMNCFLHGIEDFRIERGDTLAEPKLVEGDKLMQFDVVLANPPYSIKQWDREAFGSDPWGRNLFGIPPQGRADYAFQQHIMKSLKPKTGRCAVLWPHGILFRQEEDDVRKKMVEADLVEAVIGMGPNLFYNSSMESCVLICRASKPKERRGKIIFINAQNEVARERTQSFLTAMHIERIVAAYRSFKGEDGFTTIATLDEVRARGHSLKIDLYVEAQSRPELGTSSTGDDLGAALRSWENSRASLRGLFSDLLGSKVAKPVPIEIAKDLLATFDRSEWKRVRFGDVVSQMREQVNPGIDGITRYVAGEHMETENIRIRKWGTVGDGYLGPAFIRGFRKGQVLYGSRRTYLKKVAVAEWDGVTANTTFVLQTNEDKMLQDFLPWLMLSERFTKHSVQESKGSTNPYINFPDIAKFEFDLPPLDQQRRMIEILWAADETVMKTIQAAENAKNLVDAELSKFLYDGSKWRIAACRELLAERPRNGFSPPASSNSGKVPTLSISAIRGGKVVPAGSLKYADVQDEMVDKFKLRRGDILVVRGNGNRQLCGRAGIVEDFPESCFYPDLLIRLRFREDALLQEFAVMQWNERITHTRLLKKAKSSNGISKINGQDIQSHQLFVPPIKDQTAFLQQMKRKNKIALGFASAADEGKKFQSILINRLFQ